MRAATPTQAVVCLVVSTFLFACEPSGADVDQPAQQQESASSPGAAVITDVLADLEQVQERVLSLAEEFGDGQYAWRPSEGVRSGAEVFMHVAAINYFFPSAAGIDPPEATGLDLSDPATTFPAYEASASTKDSVLVQLRASFQHLRTAIESTRDRDLDQEVEVFGQPLTLRLLWIGHGGHLHEHLGQLIAYARVNGVVPPWSQ
jgi:uncharacterized damage-inducible protein DinB